MVKYPPAIEELQLIQVQSLGGKIPWRMVCQPTPARSPVSEAVCFGDLRARLKPGGDFRMVGDTGADNGVVWGRQPLTFW